MDFYDLKADLEALLAPRVASFRKVSHPALHPGRAAEVVLDGHVIGVLGELHPQWVQKYDLPAAPVLFEVALDALLTRAVVKGQPVSRFQPVRRDLALVMDESVEAGSLLAAFQALVLPGVTGIGLFDVYRGKGLEEGKKSLAFKVLMQDTAKTLTDAEVDAAVQAIIDCAALQGASLRL